MTKNKKGISALILTDKALMPSSSCIDLMIANILEKINTYKTRKIYKY